MMVTEITRATDSWTPVNLNALPEKPPVPPNLGGTHLVYPGKRHVFSGAPESAKTLAAYCVLIQVVRCGGTGVLIDFEMGGFDARQRLRELGASSDEISRIYYLEPDEPATPQRINLLVTLEPDLVVIDAAAGVYTLEGLDDNKRLDVEKISSLYVRAFWRNEVATILIDHVVKDGEHRGRYAIGSERKLGGADVHLGFETVKAVSRGTTGHYKIITHKDRGGYHKRGHIADLKLDSDPATHEIAWSFAPPSLVTDEQGLMRPSIKMEQISTRLYGREDRLTVNEVKDLVGGNKKLAGDAINILIHEGYIDAADGPRNSKLLLLSKPYLQSNDPLVTGDPDTENAPIPDWFSSSSGTGATVTGSLVPGVYTPEPVEPLSQATPNGSKTDDWFQPETSGWFGDNGHLEDAPDLAWLDTVDPPNDEPY